MNPRFVDGKRGLRSVGEWDAIGNRNGPCLGDRFDEGHRPVRELSHRADHLGVAGMADEDDVPSALVLSLCFVVHLEDQRAGRVDKQHVAVLRRVDDRAGDAVGRQDDWPVLGNIVQFGDEDSAGAFQIGHDAGVVHDLVTDVYRGTEALEGALDDQDRAVDASAKAAWTGQEDGEGRKRHSSLGIADSLACRDR